MTLQADGWETVWEAHWPINRCAFAEHGVHLMHKSGELFQCEACLHFFAVAETEAFMSAANRIAGIVNDRHRQN